MPSISRTGKHKIPSGKPEGIFFIAFYLLRLLDDAMPTVTTAALAVITKMSV